MPSVSSTSQSPDPYLNFKFRIKWQGKYVAGLSKCSALKRSTEATPFREGGDPSTNRILPGQTKFEPITLERGMTQDLEFETWVSQVWNYRAGQGMESSLANFRRNIVPAFPKGFDIVCTMGNPGQRASQIPAQFFQRSFSSCQGIFTRF